MVPGTSQEVGRGGVGGRKCGRGLEADLGFGHACLDFSEPIMELGLWKHAPFWIQEAQGVGLLPEEVPPFDVGDVLGEFPSMFPELFDFPGGEAWSSHDGSEFLGREDFGATLAVEGACLNPGSIG